MKQNPFQIKKLSRKIKPFKKRLAKALSKYTESKAGPLHLKEQVWAAYGEKGKPVGGLFGLTYWNAFYIDGLFVEGRFRKKGLGRQLVEKAWQEARERGLDFIHLNTHSLQAPGFYKKPGYKAYGHLKGYPRKQSSYSFYKKL